jgi:hypothetical protein
MGRRPCFGLPDQVDRYRKVQFPRPAAGRKGDARPLQGTGLEPATPGVTGRYSNQLNYHSAWWQLSGLAAASAAETWRPLGDSNPCYNRERVVS